MKYNKTVIIAALMLSTLLVSCDKELFSEAAGNGIPMQLIPSVAGADTRASIGTDDLTEFYLQIVCQDSTYSYFEKITRTDAVWGTDRKLYWKDETTPITYTAAYFSGHAFTKVEFKDSVNLTVPTDQSTQAKLDSADLLTVKATQIKYENTAGGKLPVALNHGLAKVNFVLTLGEEFFDNKYGLKSNPVKNFTVKGANKGFNFKPQTGTVTVTANTKAAITPLAGKYVPGTDKAKAATATFEAILVPQTFAVGELNVMFNVGAGKYSWKNTAAITLSAGKTYNLPVGATTAPPKPQINGHEYVDLGLSSGLKWATCNVGASAPEDYGDYFAWGETVPYYQEGYSMEIPCTHWIGDKTGYNWESYKWCKGSNETLTKYCSYSDYGYNGFKDGKTTLDEKDDAASYNWGGRWRMPTVTDWDELKDNNNCKWEWVGAGNTEFGGIAGYKVTSLKGGYEECFIFLPAAGDRTGSLLKGVGDYGVYWSSSLSNYSSYDASHLYFRSTGVGWLYNGRINGYSVRPVIE